MSERLKLALTKGRLEKQSVELMKKMGLDCTVFEQIGRRLIISLPNYPLDIVLAKAADVITYVENGVCDMGVVGKDTIMEQGRHFFEVLDLGFGRCRFVLAGKVGANFYDGYENPSVASKYPNVARNFFLKKGMDVKIIRIEGSLEIAPILGLTDAIVDIVETGTTLRENGLVEMEKIQDISARLIVNVGSMRMKKQQVNEFIGLCKQHIKGFSPS